MLAGALKDNKRAIIAGERTFGKGLIQTVVELSDGSAVAVTVSRHACSMHMCGCIPQPEHRKRMRYIKAASVIKYVVV